MSYDVKKSGSEPQTNLSKTLDAFSTIIKKIDQVRATITTFNTMIGQIKLIIHNQNVSLTTLTDDVGNWFLHTSKAERMRVACLQKLKSEQSERGVMIAAQELSKILDANKNVQKSMRRFARLIKLENYSNDEELKDRVMLWINKWKDKWTMLENTYKSLRAELLDTSKSYQKIFTERTSRHAVFEKADDALNDAHSLVQENIDTPEPLEATMTSNRQQMMNPQMMNQQMMNQQMMNPQMVNQQIMNQQMMNLPVKSCGNCGGSCGGNCERKRSRPTQGGRPRPGGGSKKSRRRVGESSGIIKKASGTKQSMRPPQKQQPEMALPPGMTPEMLQQFMAMQQQQAPPAPQYEEPVKESKVDMSQYKNLLNPSTSISYGGGDDNWS